MITVGKSVAKQLAISEYTAICAVELTKKYKIELVFFKTGSRESHINFNLTYDASGIPHPQKWETSQALRNKYAVILHAYRTHALLSEQHQEVAKKIELLLKKTGCYG